MRTAQGPKREFHHGQGILWRAGEDHESGTDEGMIAFVVEARELRPAYEDDA